MTKTRVIIVGGGEGTKAQALIERMKQEGSEVEVIHVENIGDLEELKEKGIVVHEGSIMTLTRPRLPEIEIIQPKCYGYEYENNGRSKHQKRQYRLPASPINKRKRR